MLQDIQRLLSRELQSFQREIELFPDDELLWLAAPGVTNSAGNLALHICGNLQHFVGAVLGHTGYVRNREAEFTKREGSRADLVRELAAAQAVVERTLSAPEAESWVGQPYPVPVNDVTMRTELWLLHLASHAAFHLGQAGYLRRMLTRDAHSAGPLPLRPLADPV